MAGKKKRSRAVTALLITLLVISCGVFVWSGYMLLTRANEYQSARDEYADLRNQFRGGAATQTPAATAEPDAVSATDAPADTTPASTAPADTTAAAGSVAAGADSSIDFAGLAQVNADVVGWVEIPGTDISYPVVQTADNDRYLKTGFDGGKNSSGAIFADKDCRRDLMGAHTLIYGHHMRDGSMFAHLVDFKDADFFAQHDRITLFTPQRTITLTVVAAYAQKADSSLRRFAFGEGELAGFMAECVARSANVRDGVDLAGIDRLYSFVTCSYEADDMRTIVHAVELPQQESDAVHAQALAAQNAK